MNVSSLLTLGTMLIKRKIKKYIFLIISKKYEMYNNRGHINHKNVTSSSSSLIDTFCVNYKNRTKLLDQKSKQIHIQENGGAKDLVVIVCR